MKILSVIGVARRVMASWTGYVIKNLANRGLKFFLAGLILSTALIAQIAEADARRNCDDRIPDCLRDDRYENIKNIEALKSERPINYIATISESSYNIKNYSSYFPELDKNKDGMFDNVDLDSDGNIDIGPNGDGNYSPSNFTIGDWNSGCSFENPCIAWVVFDPITGVIFYELMWVNSDQPPPDIGFVNNTSTSNASDINDITPGANSKDNHDAVDSSGESDNTTASPAAVGHDRENSPSDERPR